MSNLRSGTRPGNVTVSRNREKCTDNGPTMHQAPGGRESQEMRSLSPRLILVLLPVARDPDPADRSVHPLTPNPHGSCSRRRNPTARDPHVVSSGPAPVAGRPHVSRAGDRRLRFNANCWGSPGHHDLPGRTGCCHFLRGCRGCHCRWFLSAADEEKWGKRQYINTSSHISLLAMDSFRTRNSALFDVAIDDFSLRAIDSGKRILIR